MTETARLVVEADTTSVRRASDDLKEFSGTAAPAAAKASDQYRQEVSRANNETGIFGKGVGALKANIVALAGTMTVGVFTSWIKGAIDAADATGKAAQSAGLALDEYTKLDMAFELGAGEGANLAMVMNKLSTEVATGGAQLAALGIQTTTASGELRSSYQVMLDVADQFKSMEDGAEKTGLAIELFGERAGPKLIPMLNQGRKGMEEAGAAAATVSDNLYKMSEAANDNVTILGGLFNTLRNEIAERLLPRMNDMLEWAIKFGPTLKPVLDVLGVFAGLVGGALSFALKSVMTTLSIGIGVFTAFGQVLATVAAGLSELASGSFTGAYAAVTKGLEDIGGTAKKTTDQLIALWGAEEKAAQAGAIVPPVPTVSSTVAAPAAPKATDGFDADKAISLAKDLALEEEYRLQRMAKKEEEADFYAELEFMRRRDSAAYAEEDHQRVMDRINAEVKAQERGVQAIGRVLAAGAAKNRTIAKAALAFNKVMALTQIAQDTPVAALAAAKSVAGIPIVGAKLAFLAYNAVYGLGYAAYASVLSGKGGGGGGSSAPSIAEPAGGSSLSQNTVQPSPVNSPNIILRLIGGGRRYTVEEVAELMEDFGERLADNGGRIGKVQVQVA